VAASVGAPKSAGGRVESAARPQSVAWGTVAARSVTIPARFNGSGEIDYRLARQALIAQYRAGRIARNEVCDAHPELRRNAAELGLASERPCPICGADDIVLVTYVFGTRLPASGRCLSSRGELAKIARRRGTFTGYVVEVCTECWWNHLMRSFPIEGR
jgi:hypothetical protein